jgi:hypothetical protein
LEEEEEEEEEIHRRQEEDEGNCIKIFIVCTVYQALFA